MSRARLLPERKKLGKRHLSSGITRTSRHANVTLSTTLSPDSGAPHGLSSPEAQEAAQWARVRARLQSEVGDVEYRSWFRQMTLGSVDGDEVTVHLPSRFLRDWVRSNYGEKITSFWQQENAAIRRVDIRVGGGQGSLAESLAPAPAAAPSNGAHAPAGRVQAVATSSRSGASRLVDDLSAPLDPSFSFESFVVGKPNEFAYACARRVAERPGSKEFNPLFLYGGVGLGKTHLMHAIGVELTRPLAGNADAPRPTVAYMSAEKFMYRFIAALRSQQTIEFKDHLRSVDVLMIDDLQFLIGKDNTQEEFFHTFNALVDAGKQIVVSADKSPSDLNGLEDRLRTRLGCGIVADLHATTFELRISILEAKVARANAKVPAGVLEFLARKLKRCHHGSRAPEGPAAPMTCGYGAPAYRLHLCGCKAACSCAQHRLHVSPGVVPHPSGWCCHGQDVAWLRWAQRPGTGQHRLRSGPGEVVPIDGRGVDCQAAFCPTYKHRSASALPVLCERLQLALALLT